MSQLSQRKLRRALASSLLVAVLAILTFLNPAFGEWLASTNDLSGADISYQEEQTVSSSLLASDVLNSLAVRDRDESRDYNRKEFYSSWDRGVNGCTMRESILARDLTGIEKKDDCKVQSGQLADPYTGKEIHFQRGQETSSAVQIDHVVALSNAWSTGAAELDSETRHAMSQDPLNLIAVDGPANQEKSDQDASEWLPSNQAFQCQYVARQISVKYKYGLWVTRDEKAAMQNVLKNCPEEQVVGIELEVAE